MTPPELRSIAFNNGLIIFDDQLTLLETYAALLKEWNSKINLISRQDEEHILDRHILHSLVLLMPAICNYEFSGRRIADLGTGGGLPGIPLKIMIPSVQLSLMDSIQKKITVCSALIQSLGLRGIEAVRGRAEELAQLPEYARGFDAVISRAVAPMDELAKWSKGLLKPNGMLFSLKGGDLTEEIARTKRLKYILEVEERPLKMKTYDNLEKEEKKLVIAYFRD